MSTDDVYVFEIAPEDFDAGLLPEPARQAGSPEFKDQVRWFFERNLEAFAGWHDIRECGEGSAKHSGINGAGHNRLAVENQFNMFRCNLPCAYLYVRHNWQSLPMSVD
jgi:hypothetical protein